jgi:tRNA-specific 2-thiouridylase
VSQIEVESNIVWVTHGTQPEPLYSKKVIFTECKWHLPIPPEFQAEVQVRYRQPAVACKITKISPEKYQAEFEEALRAPAPGQSLVAYTNNTLLGGGVIKRVVE